MSQIFVARDETLWNPATEVAQLYFRMAEVMTALVDLLCGIEDVQQDEYAVDTERLRNFVEALARRYLGSTNLVLRATMEGFLATSIVMVTRAGGTVNALTDVVTAESRNLSVGPDGRGPQGDSRRLASLVAELSTSMPR